MHLTTKVLNRLRLGGDVATQLAPRLEGNRAWLIVTPLIPDSARVPMPYLSESYFQEVITGYEVMYAEISTNTLERIRDDDLRVGEAVIEKAFASSEAEISDVLKQWLRAPSLLRHPGSIPDATLVSLRVAALFSPVMRKDFVLMQVMEVRLDGHGNRERLEIEGDSYLGHLIGRGDKEFLILSHIDPYDDTVFNGYQMPLLLPELDRLLEREIPDNDRAIIVRLRNMAQLCQGSPGGGGRLRFIGD